MERSSSCFYPIVGVVTAFKVERVWMEKRGVSGLVCGSLVKVDGCELGYSRDLGRLVDATDWWTELEVIP